MYDVDTRDDKKRRRENKWKDYVRKNYNNGEKTPIDLFFPLSMPLGGMMNSPKDTKVNGKKKYARVLIRRKR